MKIQVFAQDEVSLFAASELESYLSRMGRPALDFQLRVQNPACEDMPPVADAALDDQYVIEVHEQEQLLCGNNPRALLLAVYRYLTLVGCRFPRPGKAFETVPMHASLSTFYAAERKTASLRHRGVCIEGTDSVDNIVDFLDWMPKVGYNSFFFQFKTPFTFLNRWHGKDRPGLPANGMTEQHAAQLLEYFDQMMAQRGMLRHRMGHGWTAEAIGAAKLTGWETEDVALSDEVASFVAEVDGVRGLHHGVAVNTNLCLSNPLALERFAACVLNYLRQTPDTEYLHIWLADGANNSCSCEKCRSLRPSDHYVTLLNYLDKQLTKAGIPTRLVLLIYEDLLWAPLQNRLKNPDRFVLMFAPITRSYDTSFADIETLPEVPAFHLNRMRFPGAIDANMAFLQDWKKSVPCDSFTYDYPLARAHHGDPTHVGISRTICRDLHDNPRWGINGIISCQELRNAYPNALGNYVMARASFDRSVPFETLAQEYYQGAYGGGSAELLALMEKAAALFSPDYLNYRYCPTPRLNADIAARMQAVPAVLEEIRALRDVQLPLHRGVEKQLWAGLDFFLEHAALMARMMGLRAEGKQAEALALWEEAYIPLLKEHEKADQPSQDVDRNIDSVRWALEAQ